MKTLYKIVMILVFSSMMFATGGGSLYTRYGAGDVIHYFSARHLGMGAIGVTSSQMGYVNFVNPASLNNVKVVRFESGFTMSGAKISSSEKSAFYSGSEFSGFGMVIPIERDYGITLGFGMVPYTHVQYEVRDNSNSDYNTNYSGTGGISKAYISASYTLPIDVSLGFSFNYFTGNIEYNSKISYTSNTKLSGEFKKVYNYRGAGFSVGLETGDLSSVIGSESISDLKFGLVYNYSKNLPTDTTGTIKTGTVKGIERTALIETDLPSRLDVGLSFILNKNKRILADYSYQPWNEYEVNHKKISNLKALNRFSVGIEFIGDPSIFASAIEQMDFRLGFSYEDTHLKIKDENLSQISLHAGFSYPLGALSTIDVGFQVGKRGTKDFGLMEEMFYKANFSLSLGDIWFIRIER